MEKNRTKPPSPVSPPQLVVDVFDEPFGKLGYVVIDRPVQGIASGGVRFAPDVSVDELAGLARSMTYKWAFLNVPLGGAKSGIFADPSQLGCDRATLMEAFGRSIAPLVRQHVYYPGVDLGTTLDDLRAIMRGVGQPLPEKQIDGSFCTALTVFEAIRQTIKFNGLKLANLRVAVEGFGKVASTVIKLLAESGAKIVAVSTLEGAIAAESGLDMPRLLTLKQQHGDALIHHYQGVNPIPLNELFTQRVDLLVPGARPHVIRADNATLVQARFIVPISNVPMTPEAEQMLIDRGIVVMPDFVANCGGILASSMLSNSFDENDARYLVEGVLSRVVEGILQRASQLGRPVSEIARGLAWRNHCELDQPATTAPSKVSRIAHLLAGQGWDGTKRRLAWRIYRRWPRLDSKIRRVAVDRYAELTLGNTLNSIATSEGEKQ